MAELTISKIQKSELDKQISKQIEKIFNKTIIRAEKEIFKDLGEILANKIKNSSEFGALKTTLAGEFGFTSEEIANLDRIIPLLIPSPTNEISKVQVKVNGKNKSIIFEWVDFDKLKEHPFAQHDLTKLNRKSGNFDILTARISWIDWLENGATIRGYTFSDGPKDTGRSSRSGKGIMRKSDGGLWTFQPTDLFTRIANGVSKTELQKGFGILLERVAKGQL